MKLTDEQLNEHRMIQKVLIKSLFESSFPGFNLDEADKEDLASLAIDLQDRINKLRNPKYHITSKKLINLYLKSVPGFPELQANLMKLLSNQQPKDKKVLIQTLYGRKNDSPDAALRQLTVSTNETIKASGSADVFHIEGKKGQLTLKIKLTNLGIYIKKRSR